MPVQPTGLAILKAKRAVKLLASPHLAKNTGDIGLDISTVALVNSIGEVDASAFTGALSVAIAAGGTNGVKITGGSKADTITSSDAADIINGGGGFDAITIRATNTGAVIKSDVRRIGEPGFTRTRHSPRRWPINRLPPRYAALRACYTGPREGKTRTPF